MNSSIKTHIIYCGVIVILLFSGLFGYTVLSNRNQRDLEEKIRSDERAKQYELDAQKNHEIADSAKISAAKFEAVLEYKSKNPQIIIQKYDKIHDNVVGLSANNKVKFLAERLSKAHSH